MTFSISEFSMCWIITKLNSVAEQCGSEMKEALKKSWKRDLNGDLIVTKYLQYQKKGCQTDHDIHS